MNNLNHITKDELVNLGVSLDDDAMAKQLNDLNEKVNSLIGSEIIASLTSDDAEELAAMQKNGASDDEIGQWIGEHVPDYGEIIEDNRDIVLGEFVETSGLDDES